LPHVSGAHQADILNYHFSRTARGVARVANGRPPKSKLAEAAPASRRNPRRFAFIVSFASITSSRK
jgi:hypothetical protein